MDKFYRANEDRRAREINDADRQNSSSIGYYERNQYKYTCNSYTDTYKYYKKED